MRKIGLLAGFTLLAVSGAAMAQTAQSVPGYPDVKVVPVDKTPAPTTGAPAADGVGLRKKLSTDLQKAGYTDVKVVPEAFLVQAKNQTGEPVTMFISPDSLTVFTAVDAKGQDSATAGAAPPAAAPSK